MRYYQLIPCSDRKDHSGRQVQAPHRHIRIQGDRSAVDNYICIRIRQRTARPVGSILPISIGTTDPGIAYP